MDEKAAWICDHLTKMLENNYPSAKKYSFERLSAINYLLGPYSKSDIKRVIEEAAVVNRFAPQRDDFAQIIQKLGLKREQSRSLKSDCQRCNGSGLEIGVHTQTGKEMAFRCRCEAGKSIDQKISPMKEGFVPWLQWSRSANAQKSCLPEPRKGSEKSVKNTRFKLFDPQITL